jgi:hypothetical protein
MLWGYAKYCACLLLPVSHVDRLSFIIQAIGIQLMANLPQQKLLSHSVYMIALSLQSTASSKKHGDTSTRTGMCDNRVCVCLGLDNAPSRKGLDTQQAAFANKKYKSHRRVGLPSDIIASMAL